MGTKDNRIATNLEDDLLEPFEELARREGISQSALLRRMIVTYLMERDLLPDTIIKRLVTR